jgi:hypothetical protein
LKRMAMCMHGHFFCCHGFMPGSGGMKFREMGD